MIWVAGRSPTSVSQNFKATTLTYLAIEENTYPSKSVTGKPLFDPTTPSSASLSLWEGIAAVGVLMMTADEDTAPEEFGSSQ